MTRIVLTVILVVSAAACSRKQDSGASSAASDSYLTVGAYCTGFCSKLCGTCGQGRSGTCALQEW